jgi:opacity protein-like surface antigen
MKKLILGISILLFTSTAYSQDKGWSIGIIGSPNFYSVKSHEGFNHSYQTDLGLTIGLESIYSLSNKLDLGLGANLTSLGYQVNYEYTFLDPGDPYIPRSGNITANYIDIPIFLRVNLLSSDKFALYPSVAFNSLFLINSKDQTTFEDNSVRESNYLNSLIFSGQFGLGVAYSLNEKMRIKLEPRFRYYLKGFDTIMNAHPTLFQAMIGIEYKIGKKE